MNYLKHLICILFIVSIIFSCSGSKSINPPKKEPTILEIIKNINSNADKIRFLKAEGNLSIETPQNAFSGGFKISIRKPDSIFLQINGPFGIVGAKSVITTNTFTFYNVFESYVIKGRTSSKALTEILQINTDFDNILSILSCSPDFHREGLTAVPNDSIREGNKIILNYSNDEFNTKYWIDVENNYITSICMFDKKGKLLLEEKYFNYKKNQNVWLPYSFDIIFHKEKQSLSATFSEIIINDPKINFKLTYPNDIKIIEWK